MFGLIVGEAQNTEGPLASEKHQQDVTAPTGNEAEKLQLVRIGQKVNLIIKRYWPWISSDCK